MCCLITRGGEFQAGGWRMESCFVACNSQQAAESGTETVADVAVTANLRLPVAEKELHLRNELRHVPLRHIFRPHGLLAGILYYVFCKLPCAEQRQNRTRSDTAELAGFVILQGSCASFAEAEPCQDAGRILEKIAAQITSFRAVSFLGPFLA